MRKTQKQIFSSSSLLHKVIYQARLLPPSIISVTSCKQTKKKIHPFWLLNCNLCVFFVSVSPFLCLYWYFCEHTSMCMHVCYSMCVPLHVCLHVSVHMHVCLSGVQQVKPGRRSCWPACSIGLARKDQPTRPTNPPRTAAASLPSFTLSASICSVPFW